MEKHAVEPVAFKQLPHGISSFLLKCIAMISMVTDHVGSLFFPNVSVLNAFGRLAFPIYCFLICNGFFHAKKRSVYLGRLMGFAALSQIPFTLLRLAERDLPAVTLLRRFHLLFDKLNSLFVLSLGLFTLILLDLLRKRYSGLGHFVGLMTAAGLTLFSWLIHCEYCFLGIPLIVAFYEAHLLCSTKASSLLGIYYGTRFFLPVAAVALYVLLRCVVDATPLHSTFMFGLCQTAAVFLTVFYSGKQGYKNKFFQYGFYIFYPAHLVLLVIIHAIL